VITVEIRRVRTDDWETLRDVRLHALSESPDAFRTTHDQALARDEQWWRDWADVSATCDDQAMYLAWLDGKGVGIAGVYSGMDGWQVISMWVDPAHRGRGAGGRLLDEAVGFARAHGAGEVLLSVTDGNDVARRLYEQYGFADTGANEPLRPDSRLTVREMRLTLD
jgi:ribosomal protein S18 acetylase RimI-like enzyme